MVKVTVMANVVYILGPPGPPDSPGSLRMDTFQLHSAPSLEITAGFTPYPNKALSKAHTHTHTRSCLGGCPTTVSTAFPTLFLVTPSQPQCENKSPSWEYLSSRCGIA